MKKRIACFVGLFVLLSSLLCGYTSAEIEVFDEQYYKQLEGQDAVLYVYNWGEYISDGSDESLDVVAEFEELTGIDVSYTTFASNEEMYAKIKSGGAQYDILVPSDYMIARMISEDMLLPLDYDNIPCFSNIDDEYKGREYDPNDEYSVPYMWGLVGLIYNTTMIEDEITSWNSLWDQKYFGNILMFENSRDAFGISLLRLGYSVNTTDPDEIREAADQLKEQKMLVQAYVMDQIFDKMGGGEAAIAPYYVGDAITMMDENPDLAFVYPEEGTNYFVDAFVIPKGSENKLAAEMFINFMCEVEISAANADYIGYSSPISASVELLELDEEIKALAYPETSVIDNSQIYTELPEDINVLTDQLWTEIRSFNETPNDWIGPVFLFGCVFASLLITILRARKRRKDQL